CRVSTAVSSALCVWIRFQYWRMSFSILHSLVVGIRMLLSPTSSRIMVLVRLPVAVAFIVLLRCRNKSLTTLLVVGRDTYGRSYVNRRLLSGLVTKELSTLRSGSAYRLPPRTG